MEHGEKWKHETRKWLILHFLIAVLLHVPKDKTVLSVPVAHAQTLEYSPRTLKAYALMDARDYKINATQFLYTIDHESSWQWDALGDYTTGNGKFYTKKYAPPGAWPTSFGLCQLHYPSTYWGIATSSAMNPYTCMDIMAQSFSKGQQSKWSAWSIKYGSQ